VIDVANAPLSEQVAELERLLGASDIVPRLLDLVAPVQLPNWYLGAGAVSQTVWNLFHGFDPDDGIRDYDIVYFDPDVSPDREQSIEYEVTRAVGPLGVQLDVKNQARVHLWYADRFGKPVEPYESCEQAIRTWPSTASCIGVRRTATDAFVVCAPHGLHDLFAMVVRPNKTLVREAVFRDKSARWQARWPKLRVLEW